MLGMRQDYDELAIEHAWGFLVKNFSVIHRSDAQVEKDLPNSNDSPQWKGKRRRSEQGYRVEPTSGLSPVLEGAKRQNESKKRSRIQDFEEIIPSDLYELQAVQESILLRELSGEQSLEPFRIDPQRFCIEFCEEDFPAVDGAMEEVQQASLTSDARDFVSIVYPPSPIRQTPAEEVTRTQRLQAGERTDYYLQRHMTSFTRVDSIRSATPYDSKTPSSSVPLPSQFRRQRPPTRLGHAQPFTKRAKAILANSQDSLLMDKEKAKVAGSEARNGLTIPRITSHDARQQNTSALSRVIEHHHSSVRMDDETRRKALRDVRTRVLTFLEKLDPRALNSSTLDVEFLVSFVLDVDESNARLVDSSSKISRYFY